MSNVNIFSRFIKINDDFLLFYIDACRSHFNRLPYDVVKPILDAANPEQLTHIIDNNPV